MSIITLKNINKAYGEKRLFDNFNLAIEPGEFLAVMGPSGCGKSTLLNIVGLLEGFESGELIIDGDSNITPNSKQALKILRYKISYLFQNFALIEDESVEDNINLALKYINIRKSEKQSILKNAMYFVGMENSEKKKTYELSGGEQQRISIARGIVKPCKIILADEPTGSLDTYNRDIVLKLLKKLNQEGKTIIIATHDENVSGYCNRRIHLQ